MVIFGIDPGYAIVGCGVVRYERNNFSFMGYGAVTTHKDTVVAAVVAADEEIELPAAAPADGAAAEPEVIGAKKADAADAPAKK